MKRVLITGMTAQHTSARLAIKNVTIGGLLASAFEDAGASVVQCALDVNTPKNVLDEFDAVIVGVSPILSMTANTAYGALNAISLLSKTDKLRLLIDAPDPEKIGASLRSIAKTPANIAKPIHSARQGYKAVLSDKTLNARLQKAVDDMLNGDHWKVLYPKGYGTTDEDVATRSSMNCASVSSIDVDGLIVRGGSVPYDVEKEAVWLADQPKSSWSVATSSNLKWGIRALKEHRTETDADIVAKLSTVGGLLVSPSPGGMPWWNVRVCQAMNAATPVAMDWRFGQSIGPSWSFLPASIEELSRDQRIDLVAMQRIEFLLRTQDRSEVIENLLKEFSA